MNLNYRKLVIATTVTWLMLLTATAQGARMGYTIGYNFDGESTVLTTRQDFTGDNQNLFEINEPPSECFQSPGVSEVNGVTVSNAADALWAIEVSGAVYGEVKIKCSVSEVVLALYPGYVQQGELTKILAGVPRFAAVKLASLKETILNSTRNTKDHLQPTEDCLINRNQEDEPVKALCFMQNWFVAVHFYTGKDSQRAYWVGKRDEYFPLIQKKFDNVGKSAFDGIPIIYHSMGPVVAESFVADQQKYRVNAAKFHVALNEIALADIRGDLNTMDQFLEELE